jgi:hypothetical protein
VNESLIKEQNHLGLPSWLTVVYPEYEWNEWYHSQLFLDASKHGMLLCSFLTMHWGRMFAACSTGFWAEDSNKRKFMQWLEKKLGYNKPEGINMFPCMPHANNTGLCRLVQSENALNRTVRRTSSSRLLSIFHVKISVFLLSGV